MNKFSNRLKGMMIIYGVLFAMLHWIILNDFAPIIWGIGTIIGFFIGAYVGYVTQKDKD